MRTPNTKKDTGVQGYGKQNLHPITTSQPDCLDIRIAISASGYVVHCIVQCPALDPVQVGNTNARGTVHADVAGWVVGNIKWRLGIFVDVPERQVGVEPLC